MSSRRRFLKQGAGTLFVPSLIPALVPSATAVFSALFATDAAASTIVSVRVWPAPDYSRVTIETERPLQATHFLVENPDRLVIDIEGLSVDSALRDLVAKVEPNDPYIAQIRVGQNRPNVVRLVLDLKAKVKPQVFSLAPVGEYKDRLVLDLYPVDPPDPLAALIEESQRKESALAESGPTQPAPQNAPQTSPQGTSTDTPHEGRADTPRGADEGATGSVARLVTIAIDPGHGGEDPGATGTYGTHEKNVALEIAQRVRAQLEQDPNVRCMMTRDSDYFVPLTVRVQKARRVQADLFVSIHADAWINHEAHGSSVFALSERGASSTSARWMANRENEADLIGGVNLKTRDQQLASVLLDLSTTAQISDSLKLGHAVLRELGGINQLHSASVEQAGFAVLKAPDIPSILIETAFISNPQEERRLTDDAYQAHLADAICKGIRRYFASNPPARKNRLVSLARTPKRLG